MLNNEICNFICKKYLLTWGKSLPTLAVILFVKKTRFNGSTKFVVYKVRLEMIRFDQ